MDKPMIPNTIIERMFKQVANTDQLRAYYQLAAQGNSQGTASATALASKVVEAKFNQLVANEHLLA